MAEWKPLEITLELVDKDIEKFGTVPDGLVQLFADRAESPVLAEAACDDVLLSEPENGVANMYKATFEEERGDWDAALERLTHVTERTPLVPQGWERRGLAELMLKRPSEARISFMHCLEFRPDSPQAYILLAFTYYMEDDITSAFYVLDDVYETNTRMPAEKKAILLWARAFLEKREGEFDAAFMHLLQGQMTGDDETRQVIAREMHKLMFLKPDSEESGGNTGGDAR